MSVILTSIIIGLAAGVSPGPMLVLVVTASLRYGLPGGVRVALAPLLSDIPILAVVFGLVPGVGDNPRWLGGLAIVGAIYLGWLGFKELRNQNYGLESPDRLISIKEAVTINFLNPHPWMFWLVVGGPVVAQEWARGGAGAYLFVAGFYFSLVSAKLIVASLIASSRHGLSEKGYRLIAKTAAVALLVFAFAFFWEGIQLVRR